MKKKFENIKYDIIISIFIIIKKYHFNLFLNINSSI